ncbi:eCIS core domain-containing protein [Aquimarina mytili]|uniref:DUF4157 domain-containing protein n=1 Tax=Aquimarina mytili TaxID=874423 RepID=A0A936ZMX1_9FLAO|nr:DUF4157 domain-containing protein [Aquimarina mytili]MBL0682574.1 DUF4157 domain-containing protein [Aquimarina mytili]
MRATSNKINDSSNFHSSKSFFDRSESTPFFSKYKEEKTPFFTPSIIQPKLIVGQPNDEYEADLIADKVIQKLDHSSTLEPRQKKQENSVKEEKLQKSEKKDEESVMQKSIFESNEEPLKGKVQTKSYVPNVQFNSELESNIRNTKGNGARLPKEVRTDMEHGFGENFKNIRVHTDHKAHEMNESLDAKAFTHGNDIYFNTNMYDTKSTEGKKLLAHELTHTIQQKNNASNNIVNRAIRRPHMIGTPNVGSCSLPTGVFEWQLTPSHSRSGRRVGGIVHVRIEFTPNSSVVGPNETISFIQTVEVQNWSRTIIDYDRWANRPKVDRSINERDPYFGAQWDQSQNQWADEPNAGQTGPGGRVLHGSRPYTSSTGSAVINDSPMLNMNQRKHFDTVAVNINTGRVLGSFRWSIEKSSSRDPFSIIASTTEVLDAGCSADTSQRFQDGVTSYFSTENILDGFASGSADLPEGHSAILDPIIERLNRESDKILILGGVASHGHQDPISMSRRRAESVRNYFEENGIDSSRIQIETYGDRWAVPQIRGRRLPSNRRVHIWVREP